MKVFTFSLFCVYILCSCSGNSQQNSVVEHPESLTQKNTTQNSVEVKIDPSAFTSEKGDME